MSKIKAEQFVRLWNEAVENRHSIKWIADRIGVSDVYVSVLATSLRRQGVNLPPIRRTFIETVDVNQLNRLIAEKFGGKNI